MITEKRHSSSDVKKKRKKKKTKDKSKLQLSHQIDKNSVTNSRAKVEKKWQR